jgi:rSAM/selenodomain-associated transferase 1
LRASIRIAADALVIVFARAPLAGAVKTRLVARLGAQRAARLHERLTRTALRTAAAAGCGPVELHASAAHARFDALGVTLRSQRGADLGERMHHALRSALRRHRIAVLIGADCPALRPQDLRRAVRWLRGGADVVLAPAEDGGYALIGARRLAATLFDGVPWGSARALERTARNAARAGLRVRLLRTVWDVDRPEDLERLRSLRSFSAPPQGARR